MASDRTFVDFVVDQLAKAGPITSKFMFGGYTLYNGVKIFALVCDDKLFIKPTAAGRAFIKKVVEAPPYPGAKPCFLIDEKLEDRAWLCALVRITTEELPEPKPKRKKQK